jgi:hypothetical protein
MLLMIQVNTFKIIMFFLQWLLSSSYNVIDDEHAKIKIMMVNVSCLKHHRRVTDFFMLLERCATPSTSMPYTSICWHSRRHGGL